MFRRYSVSFTVFVLIMLFSSMAFAAMPTIKADKQYFDVTTGLHVLSGNVYIEHNNRIVTAGEAKTNLVEVWASQGITFTQDDIYFTGNEVYVYFPKDLAQITSVKFSRSNTSISADKVEFNWRTKIAVFSGNVRVTQGGNSWSTETLSYNVQTNTIL